MASATTDGDDVVLELIDPSAVQNELRPEKVTSISTSGVESWNLGLLLQSPSVKVRANRNRQVVFTDQLVEQSAYFRGLLCGSFSESSLAHVSIQWNLEALVHVLQFIHGFQLHITSNNFLLILEAALYFGVERLLLECESWFQRMTLAEGQQIPMDTVIEAWNFGLEQGVGFVPELCKGYLARNFVAASRCIDKPCERHLCEALLIWLSNNRRSSQCSSDDSKFDILRKVRIALLPLEFAAGLRRDFSQLGEEAICTILDLMKDSFSIILAALVGDKLDNFRIRLTEYSEVSMQALTSIVRRNPVIANYKGYLFELTQHCILEEVAFGWGFSILSVEELVPLSRLRFCFLQISMPQLRVLRLEWVTPWMTNNDLAVLTKNCPNVVEFSLSGCKLLDSASQEIISNGWPGLTFIHLEGKGIERNFIYQAASKLPLLRKLALDLCDACEGGFDSPSHAERCFLSTVTISRCKSQKCAFDSQTMEAFRSVHKETIVIEWDCKEARTTVVKERI
ncbi:BTB POZ domain-containing protein [Musa troglodytarum]|uniref:BTB POZ domain-containing protein n=1 Tax=Musa troglodytarum TaxID=320322 RepID=A0A9E7IB57_9LILI|nr:BTB POZ domain-containing protein [Musa troglodytarum]